MTQYIKKYITYFSSILQCLLIVFYITLKDAKASEDLYKESDIIRIGFVCLTLENILSVASEDRKSKELAMRKITELIIKGNCIKFPYPISFKIHTILGEFKDSDDGVGILASLMSVDSYDRNIDPIAYSALNGIANNSKTNTY
tara:strand:- start:281 stop:712 length:432 start_codon:yes stop_codon:yes gene_type:complete